MKKYILLCLFASPYLLDAQNVTDKLVSWFPFGADCKATDASGNASSGAPVGDPVCVCGVQDQAVRFDGVDDGIVFVGTINETFTAGDFSVSFYIKPLPTTGTQIVLSKQVACDRNHAFWVRYNHSTKTISSGISENDTTLVTVAAKVDDDPCWQFIVISRSNRTYNLYVNGRLADSKMSEKRIGLDNPALFSVAQKLCPNDKPFKGDIDELRVYKKALTNEEIDKLYLRPDYIANRDTLIYLGNSFQTGITNSCALTYEWLPTDGVADPTNPNTTITPTQTQVYYLNFKHGECLARDSVVVQLIDPDTLNCNNIFIPNAFVPKNASGLNDFGISNPFAVQEFLSFEIFDRWGGRVRDFENQFGRWDGTFNGQVCNPGIYLYRLRYKCNGDEKVKAGSITLIR